MTVNNYKFENDPQIARLHTSRYKLLPSSALQGPPSPLHSTKLRKVLYEVLEEEKKDNYGPKRSLQTIEYFIQIFFKNEI